jgi:hypothetical protein
MIGCLGVCSSDCYRPNLLALFLLDRLFRSTHTQSKRRNRHREPAAARGRRSSFLRPGMATSSKARQKASSSLSTASPRSARRARSTSHALPEKDSRYNAGKSKTDRYVSSSSKKTSKHGNARTGRNRKNDESDDAESTPDEDSDHIERKRRSQLKKQKAQLRAQSPDEDLYQSSSSDSGSSSDSVQVVIASKVRVNS